MKKGITIVGKGAAQCLVPVYAFVNNAASGGYLVACAVDKIFAHEFSVVTVGSLGTNIQLFKTLTQRQEAQLYEICDKFNEIFLKGRRQVHSNPSLELRFMFLLVFRN